MIIHGTGCGLLDCIYVNEDFSSGAYQKFMSKQSGDGGLSPGQLVFSDALEKFAGSSYDDVLYTLTGGKNPETWNLGGPSAVSLVHAAQMLNGKTAGGKPFIVRFYGVRGSDSAGDVLEEKITSLPFTEVRLIHKNSPNSRVDVLSDPRYHGGSGERTFVYRKGAQEEFFPEDLQEDFFNANIITFGGTALTPHIHDNLTELLQRSRNNGAVTEVNLVYDFRSEKENPGKKWKLGKNDDAYPYIDLLLADLEEALKTSGKITTEEAAQWFLDKGCGAVVISCGKDPLLLCAGSSGLFSQTGVVCLPICEAVDREISQDPQRRGDTTGCGDNLAGQIIAELAQALSSSRQSSIDLREICIPAIAAGGFACFIAGGTYHEKHSGEKQKLLEPYIKAYREQLGC